MSLKRKASFPSIAIPQSPQTAIDRRFMDDSPKHLHCRTRKRVRNDRPDDQEVYDKTLRYLFTAQQRVQQVPTPPTEPELDEDMEPKAPSAVDPRQQTLLQFFRPVQPQPQCQPSHQPCPSTPISRFSSEPAPSLSGNGFLQGRYVGSVSPFTASDGDTMTPASRLADRDMDMDINMDMNWQA
ncbi:hypothetical protein BDW68DRAFT_169722 [Aspergillus falconensis]